MQLYHLFKTYTDGCTWSNDVLMQTFEDETAAELVANILNGELKYPEYTVVREPLFESTSCKDIEDVINIIRKRATG